MKPQDIVILLQILLKDPGGWSFARLSHELFISGAEIHAAVGRLKASGLIRDGIRGGIHAPAPPPWRSFSSMALNMCFRASPEKKSGGCQPPIRIPRCRRSSHPPPAIFASGLMSSAAPGAKASSRFTSQSPRRQSPIRGCMSCWRWLTASVSETPGRRRRLKGN